MNIVHKSEHAIIYLIMILPLLPFSQNEINSPNAGLCSTMNSMMASMPGHNNGGSTPMVVLKDKLLTDSVIFSEDFLSINSSLMMGNNTSIAGSGSSSNRLVLIVAQDIFWSDNFNNTNNNFPISVYINIYWSPHFQWGIRAFIFLHWPQCPLHRWKSNSIYCTRTCKNNTATSCNG